MSWQDLLDGSLVGILDDAEKKELFASLQEKGVTSIRLNPRKQGAKVAMTEPVPWCADAYYLKNRPHFNREVDFHLGRYYVQEASSMFLNYVLQQLDIAPQRILDMCAAPGGKSLPLIDAYPEALVICNEVDPKRHATLEENLTKWGATNVVLAKSNSAAVKTLGPTFDMILIDAPCSGEGMLRKSEAARKQYSAGLVKQCVSMQEEILNHVLPTLKPNGVLIYSTCTWNRTENENHFAHRSDLNPIRISPPEEWNIYPSISEHIPMLRFFPHRVRGEGLCMGVFQKTDENVSTHRRKKSAAHFKKYNKLDFSLAGHTILQNSLGYLSALTDGFVDDLQSLSQHLQCRPLLTLGALDRKKRLIPDIALAQQMACLPPYPRENLNPELIEKFLGRATLPSFGSDGNWIVACHEDLPLGFVKDVGRHCNNYYPSARAVR